MTAADRVTAAVRAARRAGERALFAPVFSDNPGAAYDPSTGLFLTYHQGCGTQPAAEQLVRASSPATS